MNITQKIGQWGDLHHPKIPGACTPVSFCYYWFGSFIPRPFFIKV